MIRSIEFDLVTFSPNAVRFTTIQGQRAHAERVKKQRAAVRTVLVRHFGAQTPGLFVVVGPEVQPNKIAVRFTRIAAGTLDPEENLPMAFKHVKDEVADWCGAKSDRDPIFTWGPYRQERAAPHVQRVRIEVEDLAPGEPRRVVLAETASAGREATARVKREVKKATKGAAMDRSGVKRVGNVQSYQPEEAARGASSSARAKAEAAWSKVVLLDSRQAAEKLASDGRAPVFASRPIGSIGVIAMPGEGPTVKDLRDAAERTIGRKVADRALSAAAAVEADPEARALLRRDPGEERPARELAACEVCGARTGAPCTRIGVERLVFGVHEARARAAGLQVPDDDRASVRPARATPLRHPVYGMVNFELGGEIVLRAEPKARKLATVPGQARLVARRVFLAPPWEPGKLVAERSLEGMQVPREALDLRVPLAHVARWGAAVKLYRREVVMPAHGVCWVYVARSGPEGT